MQSRRRITGRGGDPCGEITPCVPWLSSRDPASFVGLVVGGSFKWVFGLASFCLWLASRAHRPLTGVHVAGTQSPFIYLCFSSMLSDYFLL